METIKAAVIGAGNMGRHHIRIYSEMKNAELVGVSDVNYDAAKELTKKYSGTAYKDYKEMLAKEKPDCVSVVVPTALHAPIGSEVLKHSAALVEKPITLDEKEALKLIQAGRKNNNILMVGQIERFNPIVTYLKGLKHDDYLDFSIMRLGPYTPQKRTTGVILDMGIHDIDLIRYITGEEPEQVHASCRHVNIEDFEDHGHVYMIMPSSSASLVSNWISPRKIRHMYAVTEKKFLYLNFVEQSVVIYEKDGEETPDSEGPTKTVTLDKQEPLQLELQSFVNAVSKGAESPISGEDALESLKIALRATRIANQNDPNLM